jgi:hypothetical protein
VVLCGEWGVGCALFFWKNKLDLWLDLRAHFVKVIAVYAVCVLHVC